MSRDARKRQRKRAQRRQEKAAAAPAAAIVVADEAAAVVVVADEAADVAAERVVGHGGGAVRASSFPASELQLPARSAGPACSSSAVRGTRGSATVGSSTGVLRRRG
jgi:hypothetical protein